MNRQLTVTTTAILLAAALLAVFGGLFSAQDVLADPLSSDLDEPVSAATAFGNELTNEDPDPEAEPEPDPEEEPVPPPQLFGEVIPGHRIIFIVDRSCSMGWGANNRWDTLLGEMLPMLDALGANNEALRQAWAAAGSQGERPTIEFEIIRYNHGANRWKGHIQEATAFNVEHAKNWLNNTQPAGQTNWGLPLAYAYDTVRYTDIDTIYFLSDGYPNVGPNWRQIATAGRAAQNDDMRFIGQQMGGSALLHTFVELVALNQPNSSGTFIPD